MARVFQSHFANVAKSLLANANIANVLKNSTNRGSARENLHKYFLSESLPKSVQVVGGEIVDSLDHYSGQVDVIIYPKSAPVLDVSNIKLALADVTICALEVKSTLTTGSWQGDSELKRIVQACQKVKALKICKPRTYDRGGPLLGNKFTRSTIPYVIVAFDGPTKVQLESKLLECQSIHGISYECMPDMFVVLSRDYYICKHDGWLIPKDTDHLWTSNEAENWALCGLFCYLLLLIDAYFLKSQVTPFEQYIKEIA